MAIRPSGSFRRYLVAGPPPRLDDAAFYDRVREHRFRPIDDQPVEEPSSGWVTSGSFAASDFRPETVAFGPVVRLRMRVDRKRLPTNAVRVRLAEAVRDLGGRVAQAAKAKLKEEITRELLGRMVPATSVYDAWWRFKEGVVLFSATGAAPHDQFTNLFRATFGITLEAASPTPLAERVGGRELASDRLGRMAPLLVGE